jgi:hypothetical protein
MATTTNYSWTTPDNTAYVKDGASAIRTLGSSVDTTLYTALGGTYPGLRLVKKQTVGSAVSSVQVTSAFSATYDYYKIIYTNGIGSASGGINVTLGATTTGYYWGTVLGRYDNAGSIAAGGSNVASWFNMGFTDSNGNFVDIDLSMPFLTRKTGIQGAHWDTRTGGGTGYGRTGGHLADTTSYTSFTLTPSAGTITGGTIYVYGYGMS